MKESNPVILAGVDLAWIGKNNPSAVSLGVLDANTLIVTACLPAIRGIDAVEDLLHDAKPSGVAVDAPLIIRNTDGARAGELALSRAYGKMKAGCYPSNLTRFPDADSVRLANWLETKGYTHLGHPQEKWQIECYPHPALIEIFGLPERLAYKKGDLQTRRIGQANLANLIRELEQTELVRLVIPQALQTVTDPERIQQLSGQALKSNEDALDSLVCLYIAALYQRQAKGQVFGDLADGYVWVPPEYALRRRVNPNPQPATQPGKSARNRYAPMANRISISEQGLLDYQHGTSTTTRIGYININNQKVHGHRGRDGTDHLQKVYKLECLTPNCGAVYGVNDSGIYQAKCPACQGGKLNLAY